MDISGDESVSSEANFDRICLVNGDSRHALYWIASERIEESYYVPRYLVLAGYCPAACLRSAFLERHSKIILLQPVGLTAS